MDWTWGEYANYDQFKEGWFGKIKVV